MYNVDTTMIFTRAANIDKDSLVVVNHVQQSSSQVDVGSTDSDFADYIIRQLLAGSFPGSRVALYQQ